MANKRTIGGQTEGKQRATNKNDKNDKNEKENKNAVENGIAEITKCYQDNIGMFTPATAEKILSYLDDIDYEMIIQAIKLSAIRNKRTTAYISGILNNWIRKGYKVVADIQNEQQKTNKEETEEEKTARKIRELEEAMKNDY